MRSLIYTNPAATGIFIAACLVWLVPEMIGMPQQMAKVSRKEAAVQDRSSLGILIGLQWAGLTSLLICVFLGHFYRVIVEEKALIHAIGRPYIEYMRRTRRFIPLLF